jgi:hypothetical protein
VYWRVSVFFVRQRRGRPVGVCLTNPAGSWSRPYETGRKARYFSGRFQPLDAANNLLLCWFTSTFSGTLGHFKKKFCALNILLVPLSAADRQTLGFRQTFFDRFATSDRVIGCLLRNFRVSANYFGVRIQAQQGWCFSDGSAGSGDPASQPPSYATHAGPKPNIILQ